MGVLATAVDPRAVAYRQTRGATLRALAELDRALEAARAGGGERATARHHARGKLLPRERIDLLVDRDTPLLELGPLAGYGTDGPIGAAVVTALGMVADRLCVLVANDPTVRDGTAGTATLEKIARAQELAYQHRVPMINLIEGVAADPADRSRIFPAGARVAAASARLTAAGVPTVGVCFGDPSTPDTLAGVDLGWACEQVVAVRPVAVSHPDGRTDGRDPHPTDRYAGRTADHYVHEEREALQLARDCIRRWPTIPPARLTQSTRLIQSTQPTQSTQPPPLARPPVPPKHDLEDLLAVPPWAIEEILARVLDGSEFDEGWPGDGHRVCTGWGRILGHQVAVVADRGDRATRPDQRDPDAPPPRHPSGPPDQLGVAEADQVIRFVARAATTHTPLLFLRQGAPAMAAETAIAAAIARCQVPMITVRVGAWCGVPAVSGQARFRFAWPAASAAPAGVEPLEPALCLSGQQADDGVIDPRDTRTVIGLCLAFIRAGQS